MSGTSASANGRQTELIPSSIGPVGDDAHACSLDTLFALLATTRSGLSRRGAAERLTRYGANKLPDAKGKTPFGVFLSQFKSPFIYLLLVAGTISLVLGHGADATFIFVVLAANAAIGTYQEWRAETRARGLKHLIKATVSVWRDGELLRAASEELVPGDIVQIESGERIAADLRLIEAHNLLVDESLLTGESLPVRKTHQATLARETPLAERVTMLHAGSMIQTGRALALVVATARDTVVGKLALALERPNLPLPLARRMTRFTRHLTIATLAIIALIAGLEAVRGADASDIFLIAIALAVSAIPEGLPVAMTIVLSIAMHRMALRHVIVRRLPAVEGLGACTLIATDKTGTLTLNRLTVERVWLPGHGDTAPDDPLAQGLLLAGACASEPPAHDGTGPHDGDDTVGDAVDIAFASAARIHGWHPSHDSDVLLERLAYEPEKRFAAAFCARDGKNIAYVKGAPETVAAFCEDIDAEVIDATRRLSEQGYRVIAVASGPAAACGEDGLSALRLVGIAGLIDPLRPEAGDAVARARAAGVQVVMITGDHPLTALAIARALKLADTPDEVVTGAALTGLGEAAFDAAVARARVFARTEPLQKLAIVESLRRQDHVVAVTGDGINDAPALHAADIGVAMGKGGTDIARDAADLILTDDNFASIVSGIEEGRIAYDNLRKEILLLVSTGAAEILLMLLATLCGLPPPLTAVQLLWLNLVTNGIQDVALAFEKGEAAILERPPRKAHAPILDRRMIEQIVVSGSAIGITVFIYYQAMLASGVPHSAAQGAALWLLVWCENAHTFNCRSETRSAFRVPLANNWFLLIGVVGAQALQAGVLAVPPLRSLLSLDDLTLRDGLSLAALGACILVVMETYKWLRAPGGILDRLAASAHA